MLEDFFTEIAIEATGPRKSLILSTSENKTIIATPMTNTSTKWELRYNDLKKSFISRESIDEIETITRTMIDFFNFDWDK